MSSNKSGRVLVAATLAATLFLAVPVQAIDGRGVSLGLLDRLAVWFVETWLSGELADGTDPAETGSEENQPTTPIEDEEDPEGCRDYTACIDPNG